jgi:hypothetical protein
MKEYLRINTFRTKSSEFYHVTNKKKKVSMNKAYILHSRFGLHIKEYKSGKYVKTYISSKRNSGFGKEPVMVYGADSTASWRTTLPTKTAQMELPSKTSKSEEFTLGKLSLLQDYVVDNFEDVLGDPNFEEKLNNDDDENLPVSFKNFRDASFILLYLTPFLSNIPKKDNRNSFGEGDGKRKRKREREPQQRRIEAAVNSSNEAKRARPIRVHRPNQWYVGGADDDDDSNSALGQLTKIVEDINAEHKAARAPPARRPAVNAFITTYLNGLSPYQPEITVTMISRIGDNGAKLRDEIDKLKTQYPNNIILKIIDAVDRAGAAASSPIPAGIACNKRSPMGLCARNMTTKKDYDLLTTIGNRDQIKYGINFLENEALTGVNVDVGGFYKRCYLCGLEWSNQSRATRDGEPKQAEHVQAVSHLVELILRISYIYFIKVKNVEIDDFLSNITNFAKMFGGFQAGASEMFMFVDSCAYCNQVKSDKSVITMTSGIDKLRVSENNIRDLLEKIWNPHRRTDHLDLKWIETLNQPNNTAFVQLMNTGNNVVLSGYPTGIALVERYKAIIQKISDKTKSIISGGTYFGKILIPVKCYGVQRVNISKLKKRFTDKEIRFIKKHTI